MLVENELPVVDKGGEFDAQLAQGLPNEKGEKGKDDGQVELPVDTRSFKEFATAHLEYVSIFRQLEQVYDQMCHPQKRQSVKKAMEVTLGRVLETRHWMKHLNDGVEYFSLDDLAKVRVFFSFFWTQARDCLPPEANSLSSRPYHYQPRLPEVRTEDRKCWVLRVTMR